jgi:hypothetical protein
MTERKGLISMIISTMTLFLGVTSSIGYTQTQTLTTLESSGRIDIYSEQKKFDLMAVKSNGKAWMGNRIEQNNRWWITEMDLRAKDKWQELWIEFTPAVPGFVYVELRGSFYPDLKINHHMVWVDDVKVEGKGAEIKNGSFENVDLQGNPVDWGYPDSSKDICSTDGSQAHTGKSCALVWHDMPLIQKIAVKAGVKYRISAWFKPYSPK